MRRVLAALLLMAAAPAGAEEWRRYDNRAFGYALDVPAAFAVAQEDTAQLVLRDGPRTLEIFGLDIAPLAFEEAVTLAIASSADEGFAVTARTVTPGWARWSGSDGARHVAVAVVPLCGTALAGFELRYQEADGAAMQPVIDRLTSTLTSTRAC